MRLETFWGINILFALIWALEALTAPSEKLPSSPLQPHAHQESNVKIYVQGAKSTLARNDADGSDSDWYPAVEQYKSHVDYDYEQESKNAEKAKSAIIKQKKKIASPTGKPENNTTRKIQPKNKNVPLPPKSAFKTICETDAFSGKCIKSNSEFTLDSTGKGQTIDQLLASITLILEKNKKQLKENEIHELVALVYELTGKIQELEHNAKRVCEDSKSSNKQEVTHTEKSEMTQQIAEIEERHTVERKLIQSKEHQEGQHQNTAALSSPSVSNQPQTERTNPNHQQPERKVPILENEYGSRNTNPNYFPVPDQGAGDSTDFFQGYAADINYNGGINKHMDDLKQQYPHGHWPDGDGSDGMVQYYTDDWGGNDYEVIDMQRHIDQNQGQNQIGQS